MENLKKEGKETTSFESYLSEFENAVNSSEEIFLRYERKLKQITDVSLNSNQLKSKEPSSVESAKMASYSLLYSLKLLLTRLETVNTNNSEILDNLDKTI